MTLGYDVSTQVRGVFQISPGNVVKPTGSVTCGGGGAAASSWGELGPPSQYERAADSPVPVSQYSVMLSRMWSRVRLPDGASPTQARAVLEYASVSWSAIHAASAMGESSSAYPIVCGRVACSRK